MTERYVIQQIDDTTFVCADTKTDLRVEFVRGHFNDTQKFSDENPAEDIVKDINDMTLWLVHHYEDRPWELDDRFYKEQLRRATGIIIRQTREAKGMSQRDLAHQAGVSTGNVANIEQGKYSAGVDIIDRLARVLEITIPIGKQ